MNEIEYKRQMYEIETECALRKQSVAREFAIAKNEVYIGDIIQSYTGTTIKVDAVNVGYTITDLYPTCKYVGSVCNKGEVVPRTDGSRAYIWLYDLEEIVQRVVDINEKN